MDSNHQPTNYEFAALTIELQSRAYRNLAASNEVGNFRIKISGRRTAR